MQADNLMYVSRGCCKTNNDKDNKVELEFKGGCCKFNVNDLFADITLPENEEEYDYYEVRFKNDRKEYYKNTEKISLETGDFVAVESSPGHDIGIVTAKGKIAYLQMLKKKVDVQKELKKIYRKAKPTDIDKWVLVMQMEEKTKSKARQIAVDLGLQMKINDVEYQGDQTKAIFYYTAEDRVDFRQLIKEYADAFKVRIEMRQIGARQEAAKLGGIGSCGRELCCSTWMPSFKTVTTGAARSQQLSLNPQKLTGQCGKLKCCLNHEYDFYVDEFKKFPSTRIKLKSKKQEAIYQKTDVFKKLMWYTYVDIPGSFMSIPVDDVRKIQEMNANGIIPNTIEEFAVKEEKETLNFSTEEKPLEALGPISERSDKGRNNQFKKRRKPQKKNED